jgi:two-component system phosphate regulon sensor histidine kinase PhoR
MYLRIVGFFALPLGLGLLAGVLAQTGGVSETFGVLIGVTLGGLIWLAIDLYLSTQFLTWLRTGEVADFSVGRGFWGEVSDRIRRLARAADQRLRESNNQLSQFLSALQASPNGVMLLDAQGHIEWLNETAAGHFGLDAVRDRRQYLGNLVRHPEFVAYLAGRQHVQSLQMPGRGDSPLNPFRLSVQLHAYGGGRLLMLSRDVTALEQAEAMRRDFVANVSHEIRTPLTVLGGFVETLQTLDLSEAERLRYLALMATQADRMQTLVKDLLTLSRLEGSPPPGVSEWVDMSGILAQLQEEARSLSEVLHPLSEATQQLVFSVTPGLEVAGAAGELLSAMSNLVSNAVRYTPLEGRIEVDLRLLNEGQLEFSVRDTGPGIAPEHLPRLTERFYRVDRSRSRETGGTGLGLAIVKHVAQRHGAELRIESQPGQGSLFRLVFSASRVRTVA